MDFETLILGGRIVDGTGNPWFRADVGISGGRIAAIGRLGNSHAQVTLPAHNRVVAPGFIDMHGHSDFSLVEHPPAESAVGQGVTTQLIGHCGYSAFPRVASSRHLRYDPPGVEGDWSSPTEYLEILERQGLGINVATLVGHSTVRAAVMGLEDRAPTPEEQERMRALVAEAMEAGAFGLSTSLEFEPGWSASTEEVVDLCRVVADYDGFYSGHLRSYSDRLFEAVNETITIARQAGLPVHLPLLKARGHARGKVPAVLEAMEQTRNEGIAFTGDQMGYPTSGAWWGPRAVFPEDMYDWQRNNLEELLGHLNQPDVRVEIRRRVEERRAMPKKGWAQEALIFSSWDDIRIEGVGMQSRYTDDVGSTVAEAAARHSAEPVDFYFDLLLTEGRSLVCIHYPVSIEDFKAGLVHPLISFGCDVIATGPSVAHRPFNSMQAHPRHYNTYPHVLGRYVREEGWLRLEEAIRKMTSLPAQQIGLRDHGLLRKGAPADVVVFDPSVIASGGTWLKPRQYPVGIDFVLVNGALAVEHGGPTGALAGQVLRRT